jgi:alcohol dehydrogenase (cytochrome c)
VLDAKEGKLIAANPYGKVNWANGIDKETGRPNVTDVFTGALEGKNGHGLAVRIGRDQLAAPVVSPQTGMLYINTLHLGMTYEAGDPPKLAPGRPSGAGTVKRTNVTDDPNIRGYLKAVDPLTGKSKWETPYKSPNYSSTMVTASNLVFTGVMTGEFQALDADTGKVLWSFQTPSGIVGQPVTWERDGKQYVTVMSGIGGVYAMRGGDPNLQNQPTGVSLWTFA